MSAIIDAIRAQLTGVRTYVGTPDADRPTDSCPSCGSSTPCIMCNGSGVYPYHTPEIKWGRCGACWGTGIEHDGYEKGENDHE